MTLGLEITKTRTKASSRKSGKQLVYRFFRLCNGGLFRLFFNKKMKRIRKTKNMQ